DGYEVYLPVADTVKLWQNLLQERIKPCGLGARDALRLEAGLPLYGHELSSEINPLEAGLSKFVELERDFVGKAMADKQQRQLIALISQDKSIPRDGYKVFVQDQEIGYITSGSFSPTLNKGIAFALVTKDLAKDTTEVEVAIRRKKHTYRITTTPFV
ncbi:MAG: glycine cleavage system protein T, partial [Clostridiaceae bacterium]|nr:glycine cleavage system protein T [Clostridiaceae bacterium]